MNSIQFIQFEIIQYRKDNSKSRKMHITIEKWPV